MEDLSFNTPSEETQEVIARIPNWIVRWGIFVVFVWVISLIGFSLFIKYPDKIYARSVFSTSNPPIAVLARTSGKLVLLKGEGQNVGLNEHIAFIESSANYHDIIELRTIISSILGFYRKNQRMSDEENTKLERIIYKQTNFGELQEYFVRVLTSYHSLRRNANLNTFESQVVQLRKQLEYYTRLNQNLISQNVTSTEQLDLTSKKLGIDEKLYQSKVLAALDLDRSRLEQLQIQKNVKGTEANILTNDIIISQINGRINEMELNRRRDDEQKIEDFINALISCSAQIDLWYRQYVLTSPVSGSISFSKFIPKDKLVLVNDEILMIVPATRRLAARILVPIGGSGKVLIGQEVLLRLDNFPAHQYGIVIGRIKYIPPVPNNGYYSISIDLPNGLKTTYNKILPFRHEMQANAEIVTENMSVMRRLANHIYRLFQYSSI